MHNYALGCITMHFLFFPYFSSLSFLFFTFTLPPFPPFLCPSSFFLYHLFTVWLHNMHTYPYSIVLSFTLRYLSHSQTPSELPTYPYTPLMPLKRSLDPLNTMLSTYLYPPTLKIAALPTRVTHQLKPCNSNRAAIHIVRCQATTPARVDIFTRPTI